MTKPVVCKIKMGQVRSDATRSAQRAALSNVSSLSHYETLPSAAYEIPCGTRVAGVRHSHGIGKPATGALPHGDGRDDRVGVWIDARDVIHVVFGNPNGVGSDGHPVARTGNRNLPDHRRRVTR